MKSIILVMDGHRYHVSKSLAKDIAHLAKFHTKYEIAACMTPRASRKQIQRVIDFANQK